MSPLLTGAVYFPFFFVFKTKFLSKLIQAVAKIGDPLLLCGQQIWLRVHHCILVKRAKRNPTSGTW